jgi:hypothetical protein
MMLELLRTWSININLDNGLDGNQINLILMRLSVVEQRISNVQRDRNQFTLADIHLQNALSYARRYDGEECEKASLLCCILKESCNLQGTQGDFVGAVLFAEEAYNCAAVAYNPVHPEVQNAAGLLIQSLTHAGNLKDAVCMNIYIYIYMYVFIYIHIFYEINICIYICIDIYIYMY